MLGQLELDRARLVEALDAILQALEVDPDNEDYKDTMKKIDDDIAQVRAR
jgi:cytochrome c-type biogenesis protein CcmH/NrfG